MQHAPARSVVPLRPEAVEDECAAADMVIGGVLIPGAAAPKLVTHDMVKRMKPGAVMVDIAIDQGGVSETSRPTSHSDPIYVEEGVVHYCVPNMPSACARTSTLALTQATLPYVVRLANDGLQALKNDPNFARSVVLLVEHGPEGAMGLVINQPTMSAGLTRRPRWQQLAGTESRQLLPAIHQLFLYAGGPTWV